MIEPLNGGSVCGPLEEQRACNTDACVATDCELSNWSEWSSCSADCDGGIRTRSRTIVVAAEHGGLPCGATAESQLCGTEPCTHGGGEDAQQDGPVPCSGCFPGTSGVCQAPNNAVCYALWFADTCVPGTEPCLAGAQAPQYPSVLLTASLRGVADASDLDSPAGKASVQVGVARAVGHGVTPDTVRVQGVAGDGSPDGDLVVVVSVAVRSGDEAPSRRATEAEPTAVRSEVQQVADTLQAVSEDGTLLAELSGAGLHVTRVAAQDVVTFVPGDAAASEEPATTTPAGQAAQQTWDATVPEGPASSSSQPLIVGVVGVLAVGALVSAAVFVVKRRQRHDVLKIAPVSPSDVRRDMRRSTGSYSGVRPSPKRQGRDAAHDELVDDSDIGDSDLEGDLDAIRSPTATRSAWQE